MHLIFGTLAAMVPHVRTGKLRGLAVTGPQRSRVFPVLPTVAEAGVRGFEVVAWDGMIAPRAIPGSLVARLNAEVNKALAAPAVRERLTGLGVEVVGGSPERFAQHIRHETAKWADVVKRAGVKVD